MVLGLLKPNVKAEARRNERRITALKLFEAKECGEDFMTRTLQSWACSLWLVDVEFLLFLYLITGTHTAKPEYQARVTTRWFLDEISSPTNGVGLLGCSSR